MPTVARRRKRYRFVTGPAAILLFVLAPAHGIESRAPAAMFQARASNQIAHSSNYVRVIPDRQCFVEAAHGTTNFEGPVPADPAYRNSVAIDNPREPDRVIARWWFSIGSSGDRLAGPKRLRVTLGPQRRDGEIVGWLLDFQENLQPGYLEVRAGWYHNKCRIWESAEWGFRLLSPL